MAARCVTAPIPAAVLTQATPSAPLAAQHPGTGSGATVADSLSERNVRRRPALSGAAAFALSAVVAAALIVQSERDALKSRRAELADVAGDKAHEIESAVQHGLTATYALAALVRQGRGVVPEFEAVATEMLRYYPGADSLQLAPGGVVRQVVPLAENARAIGHDLLADPARTKEAFLARDTGELTLAGPFPLMQGGVGAVGRLPVFIEDERDRPQFWGFTTVLIRFPDVLLTAQLPQLVSRGFHTNSGARIPTPASGR